MNTLLYGRAAWAPATLLALGLGLALGPLAGKAAETYASYDNFTGTTRLDPARWMFPERSRVVKGGVLSMIQRDIGHQTADTGSLNTSFGTNVDNPSTITQLRASMTVNAYEMLACDSNGTETSIQARLGGAFFNMGSAAPTSRINDVLAFVRMSRSTASPDGEGVLRVTGDIFQCTVEDCNSATITLGSVDLGTVAVGQTLSVRVEWDQPRKRFSFYRGSDPVQRVSYVVDDSFAPFQDFKQLGTRTIVANCLSGPRAAGFVDAKFDNFSVNQSGAP
jgi:hypothetical protein